MRSLLRIDRWTGVAACVLFCLLLTLFVFAPRLWLMRSYVPGTYQWDRAHTYLLQCDLPFRNDVEPAMLCRLLVPVVSHAMGLRGNHPLVIPWIGVIALVAYVVVLLRRRLPEARFVYGGTLLFASTSAVLVPVHWFGVNDAWVWLGLLAVAFAPRSWALAVACLLAPWIDERFVIGLPLALCVRGADRGSWSLKEIAISATSLVPYLVLRTFLVHHAAIGRATHDFLVTAVHSSVVIAPFAPLGWWMGLRGAWLPMAHSARKNLSTVGVAAVLTACCGLVLASDISRSIAILSPAVLLGLFLFAREQPAVAGRRALILAIANLAVPAAHVVYTRIDVISPLPLEIYRLLRPN